jgi:hypothetical protein
MQAYLHQYYRTLPNVKTVYLRYEPSQKQEALFDGSHLTFRGEETYVPGILRKTYLAFEFFKDELHEFDFIVRSNLSSVIDFTVLKQLITSSLDLIDYFGAIVSTLQWIDPKGGIPDHRYYGQRFASGTMIGLRPSLVYEMTESIDKLYVDVIDDVAISLHLKSIRPDIIIHQCPVQFIAVNQHHTVATRRQTAVDQRLLRQRPLMWRVKTADRMGDAMEIKYICHNLFSSLESETQN